MAKIKKATPTTVVVREHDLLIKNDIAKVAADADRAHADGCVGCRRASVCINCGHEIDQNAAITTANFKTAGGLLLATVVDRCLSGACVACCSVIHKHVDDDPMKIATRI